MNIRKNPPKCFFKFYLHISKKSSTFGTPFRVRQEGRKGQYRSAKLTGDFCLRSPHRLKSAGTPKRIRRRYGRVLPGICKFDDFF